jgi:hypothetical protein
MKQLILIILISGISISLFAQKQPGKCCHRKQVQPENIVINSQGQGNHFKFTFEPGKYHKYPTLAIGLRIWRVTTYRICMLLRHLVKEFSVLEHNKTENGQKDQALPGNTALLSSQEG